MENHYIDSKGLHLNYSLITELIEEGSSVLDLGCGDGTLLRNLIDKKNVKGKGIEINQDNVIQSIQKGLSIIQGDIDEGLKDFSDKEWDYVVLNQTLQSTEKPDYVIDEMLRVGKKVVVSFPNFGYWRVRLYLLLNGKMPKSKMLPFEWFDTPNIHLLTINDFFEFCKKRNIKIVQSIYTTRAEKLKCRVKKFFANIFAEEVIFVINS